ncbi:PorP/SprF family type IX secretion system membrane protein [Aquimarina algicola]|uniref:Type IX secretion system membrane protein PorP/SprF n=1 Tax=Aquimarina algicola TaxID=2589995 RepID=A0A504JME2_9FLAO|nr:PorP/SprF family type IX secretion system membrane protein [Aquimarina algicola]TPN87851.1 type IX secretion system membrane protein PorP/SprF [Aquimarina algicola]
MVRKILFILINITFIFQAYCQESVVNTNGILPSDIPLHNSLKYNRFLFNPTFSFVREKQNSVNIYNRNPRSGFDNNPQTYVLNYTGTLDERMGIGVGLFQQNVGIFRYFGATLNYAYNVELNRDMNLTFGMNVQYSQSGLKNNLNEADAGDEVINDFQNNSVFLVQPGVNFNVGNFDVGVSAGNLVAYSITSSELFTDNMVLTGHAMYTTELDWRTDNEIRGMVYATKPGEEELRYGGNVIFELPQYGWGQLGYNSFFGAAIGIGANITPLVSVGYTVEPGIGGEANEADFGATHEFGLAFNFERDSRSRRRRGSSSKRKTSSQKAYEARDSEIRRLKKEILEQNKIIRELQNQRGDSQTESQKAMSELERSIAEAKEKEAQALRDLELQRAEEVKLLNEQREEEERLAAQRNLDREDAERRAEEERLATARRLEREEAERKAEEERLAAARQLEQENTLQKTEEERIAQEEAAREAEAAKEQEEEDRLAAQRNLEREEAEQREEQERLAAARRLEREEAQQKAAEEQQKTQEVKTSTQAAIADGSVESLRSQADLVRSSTFIAAPEREKLLSDINDAISKKETEEAEAAQAVEAERQRQEVEAIRLAEEERKQQEAAAIEAAQLAEQQQKTEEVKTSTQEAIANGDVERLRSQADLVRSSTFIPVEERERILTEINNAISEKEAEATQAAEVERQRQEAEAIRLAEEERKQQEAAAIEAAQLAEQQQKTEEVKTSTQEAIANGDVERLRSQADLVRSSTFIPVEERERILTEINNAISEKEAEATQAAEAEAARIAEEQRKVEELKSTTRDIISTGDINALRNQSNIVSSSDYLPQVDQQSLISEINNAISQKEAEAAQAAEAERQRQAAEAARVAEEQQKTEEIKTSTQEAIANGDVEALRRQADLVRSSTFIPVEERERILTEINNAISEKEAEAAQAAEAERQRQAAEAARIAEEQRKVEELKSTTRDIIATGDIDALRNQSNIVNSSDFLPQADQQSLISEINNAISQKEAEAAQAAEAARLAEEERQRQAAEAASTANEEGLDEIKKELDNSSRITDKIVAQRDSLLTTSMNVDKREFSKLLESLVNMNDDADAAKKESDPISSKRLSAKNRFVKFAETARPEAQIATKFIPGYPEGYYLIGNVFKGGAYAEKFSGTLKDLGFDNSQIILNPENQFQYVAIESYTDRDDAIEKYTSNVDNKFFGDMWILHIAKSRVESYKKLLQETRLIKDTVKDDTVLTESLSFIGGHNIENGYYLVTNVFKRENYFERGIAKLKSQGLDPQYFRNPKDNYIYVYLKKFDNLDEAKQSLFSNVENSYNGDLYILKIE